MIDLTSNRSVASDYGSVIYRAHIEAKYRHSLKVIAFVVVLLISNFSITFGSPVTLSSHSMIVTPYKLAMSIAFLKERIMRSNPAYSEGRCLREVHSMLVTLGFNVSLTKVLEIAKIENKVSNVVSDIRIKELKPLSMEGFSRPAELSQYAGFKYPLLKAGGTSVSTSHHINDKVQGTNTNTIKTQTKHKIVRGMVLEGLVTSLVAKSEHQLEIHSTDKVCCVNSMVIQSLHTMGLPKITLSGKWQNYTVNELAKAIQSNLSISLLDEFETTAGIFI